MTENPTKKHFFNLMAKHKAVLTISTHTKIKSKRDYKREISRNFIKTALHLIYLNLHKELMNLITKAKQNRVVLFIFNQFRE